MERVCINQDGIEEEACSRKSVNMKLVISLYGRNGNLLFPKPTPETLQPNPDSVYASSKLMQEYLIKNLASEID